MSDPPSNHPTSHHSDATTTQVSGHPSTNPSATTELSSLKIKLRGALRQFQDFPSKGILFEDILPIFADVSLHEALIRCLELHILETYGEDQKPDVIVGLEARGFLFGPSLALRLGAAFVPVRKKGKLPGPVETETYQKEYGQDCFQIQSDSIKPGKKVVVVDDIIATGGSAAAAGALVKKLGGNLLGFVFVLDLDSCKGCEKLPAPTYTILSTQ
ncbi:adenine phosphoribosyltransferase [Paracoccidioides lutzii Pb01]|uniref:adenine phosphoribosyltransferase n=1 Tax=Paracoccidioides lutzii (strain ATCC MYA-826 / Pb01) TaxID=502779 RepID=C1H815_PARBA|nr:adenine phosphoribosyltransferase [Paracoccidioides lutzii Pb01]EEH36488.1 adenine phosphoribosyltransferase [Paracoccidioides lutzii Pb01]